MVFLDGYYEHFIAQMVISSPYQIGATGYPIGLDYERVKDKLIWSLPDGYDEAEISPFLDLIMSLGVIYVSQLK